MRAIQERTKHLFSNGFAPHIILVLGSFLTATTSLYIAWNIDREEKAYFNEALSQVKMRIHMRVERYRSVLLQTKAFWIASGAVSRAEFRQYFESLNFSESYPGIQGIGLIMPDFSVIRFEPGSWRSENLTGEVMFNDPIRSAAMERARDTGEPIVSGKMEGEETFLFYAPVYVKNQGLTTVEERRAALKGYVYASFRAKELFEAMFRDASYVNRMVRFEIYDGATSAPTNLLFDSGMMTGLHQNPAKVKHEGGFVLNTAGREWYVHVVSTELFGSVYTQFVPPFVLLVGMIMTVLLVRIVRVTREQAEAERTAREEGERLTTALQKAILERDLSLRKAEEAIATRDDFMSICSHELKTPLTSLKLHMQIAERSLKRGDATMLSFEKFEKYVKTTEQQTNRLVRLVEDMLDISKIRAGKLSMNLESVDLVELTREVVERLSGQLLAAECLVKVEAQGPVLGSWDRFRMEQVIVNLITNALKYAAGKPVDVSIAENHGTARLVVQDYGKGIAKEDHERIFGRFERVRAKSGISGLGLGLYIVRQIVEMHHGTIRVESEPGQGARFIMEIPRSFAEGEKELPQALRVG